MSDPIAASRLPDLPSAGYQTRLQRELSDAMMFLIRGLERNRLLLLETVIHGRITWRKRFKKAFRAIKADDEFADAVYGYLVLLAGPNPDAQKAQLLQYQAHQRVTSYDRRLRTALALARDRQDLQMDIVRESLKPKRHTVI